MSKPKIDIKIFKDSFVEADLKTISKDILIRDSLQKQFKPVVQQPVVQQPAGRGCKNVKTVPNGCSTQPASNVSLPKRTNQEIRKDLDSSTTMFKEILVALKELSYEITEQSKTNLIRLNVRLLHKFLTQKYAKNTSEFVNTLEKVLDIYSEQRSHIQINCHPGDLKKINSIYGPELGNYLSPDNSIDLGDFQVLLNENKTLHFQDILNTYFVHPSQQ